MANTISITIPNGLNYEQPLGLFINNKFIRGSGSEIDAFDPSTEEKLASFNSGTDADVNNAVTAARKAFEGPWSELPACERGDHLYKLAQLIDRDRHLLASIDALDGGKTLSAAADDIEEAYQVFKYYAGSADKISGRTIETSPAKFAYVLQEPLGVCAQIIPWNFPFMMLAWKVAPALACGNTVIVKPAEQTSLSAMYFGNLVLEAGIPEGVINIVPGVGHVTGKHLAGHMDVDKVAFTGSTATGRVIMREAASNLKNITLECGGKSPAIVFPDADLDQAVKWTQMGVMLNQGQVCTSTSRIYVHESIYDDFLKRFIQETKEQGKIGDPFNKDTVHGAIVSKEQYEKILGYIEEGKKSGPRLLYGGVKHGDKGYFIEPTVFADVSPDNNIIREEVFGPVAAIAKFSTENEVIRRCNDTSYGLSAAIFTSDVTRSHIIARKLQAGMVWVNSTQDSHFGIPFGGYKSSGIGRELGQYALDAYTQSKAVHVNLGAKL